MKKTLAIILSLALVICMMPAAAFADGTLVTTLTESMITLSSTSAEYNGNNSLPTVNVSGGAIQGTDYEVSWKDNSGVVDGTKLNAGEYTVTVTPKDESTCLSGSAIELSTKYVITKYNLNNHYVAAYVDDQVEQKGQVTTVTGIKYLADGDDKTAFLKDAFSTSVDTANKSVKFTLKDTTNFEGTISDATYKTVKNIADCNITIASTEYKGRALTTDELNSLVTVENVSKDNYTVSCTDSINAEPTTIVINGKGSYGGTVTKAATIITKRDAKKVNIAAIDNQVSGITASNVKLTITDYLNSKTITLEKGKDYDVTKVVENGSTGTVTIVFKNNYTGTIEKNFTIISGDNVLKSSDATIVGAGNTNTKSVYYSGTNQTVSVNVSKSGATYRVEYRNSKGAVVTPKDAGSYSVYVIGIGNYAGEVYAGTLKIEPIPLDWTEIVLGSSTVYDSSSKTYVPKVTLRTKSGYPYGTSGYVTIPETDYNVGYRYVNSTSSYLKPTVYVTVKTGAVNLTEALIDKKVTEVTKEFSNATRSMSYCTATFADGKSSSAYTGNAVTPRITVRDGSTILDSSTYDITYKDANGKTVYSMKDAGRYTITITGKGMYYGTLSLTYTIVGNDISGYTVTLKESSVMADGYVKVPVITSVARNSYTKLSSSDYTVSYQDADGKTVTSIRTPGTYKVIVTGAGKYSGSTYATFRVVGLSQSITGVESSYKVYPNDTFTLSPKATEGRFTYSSSDPSVAAVSSTGVVTAYKAGRAKITITTTGNTKYDQVSKSTVIKVYPKKAVITKKPWTNGKKAQLKVRWNKQENVTRYEIRYSRSKSFAKGTYLTKKVNAANNDYTTQSTTIKNLKSGYTYYVKVRAVKEVYNDYGKKLTYYGKWSGWRSVKVK